MSLKRTAILIAAACLLSACSSVKPIVLPARPSPVWAPLKPEQVSMTVIQQWLNNPLCNISNYPLRAGAEYSPSCLNAWALNMAHHLYAGDNAWIPQYVNDLGRDSVKALQESAEFQLAQSGTVTLIGEPQWVGSGDYNGQYVWTVSIPVQIAMPARGKDNKPQLLAQKMVMVMARDHNVKTNGLYLLRVRVAPIGLLELTQDRRQAQAPYIPVSELYAQHYGQPIYINNPVPAQVEIYKGQERLFSQWMPEGPQGISTRDFPPGQYQVKIIMSGHDGQFLREYEQEVSK